MRLYRLLLRLYPASFRAEYGEEMCAVFAARRRNEPAPITWLRAIAEVASNAPRVQADVLRQDVAWTVRMLRHSPGFALTALCITALGSWTTY
jgi:DsbC/DsbD-like thiol-disulfide interchange protein